MKKWFIIPSFILLIVSTVWAYDLIHTGPQIDQGVSIALDIGSTAGVTQSDGANNITGLGLVTTVGNPGSDTNVPTEQAVREGLDAVTGSGEANLAANTGIGAGKVFRNKTGVTLNFKSIKAGSNIQVVNNADDIEISTGAAVGEANTGANVGTGEATLFRDKTNVTLNFKRLQAGTGVTLQNNTNEVIINAAGGTGSGDVIGPASSTAGNTAVFADATGKLIKEVPVNIDDSGNLSGVNSVDQNPSSTPQWVFKDSDAPGSDKDIGGVVGAYLSGGDGSENSSVELQVYINGSRNAIGTDFVNPAALGDGEFKGDLVYGYNCGVTISKGQIVHINAAANPWILADADTAFPAYGIAVTACSAGSIGVIMTRGYMRDNAAYSGFTIGAPIFASNAAGGITATEPTGAGDSIQRVGDVLPSNVISFDFSRPYSNVTSP